MCMAWLWWKTHTAYTHEAYQSLPQLGIFRGHTNQCQQPCLSDRQTCWAKVIYGYIMNVFCGDPATTGEATNQYPVLLGHVLLLSVCHLLWGTVERKFHFRKRRILKMIPKVCQYFLYNLIQSYTPVLPIRYIAANSSGLCLLDGEAAAGAGQQHRSLPAGTVSATVCLEADQPVHIPTELTSAWFFKNL